MAFYTTPGQYNTYVPNTDATNSMRIDFSRNVRDFALNEYFQYIPVTKNIGYYIEMKIEQAARLLSADGAELHWPDDQDAPSQEGNLEEFQYNSYKTKRYAPGFRVGQLAAEQAEWDVLAQHARYSAQRAMTLRTQQAITLATTSGNYAASHVIDIASPPAASKIVGPWDQSTVVRSDIKKSWDYAANLIQLDTNSAVSPDQMIMVINPTAAQRLSVTQEIRDYIKQSPAAEKTVTGNLGPHNRFGLPERLYDYKVVVEKTVRVTSRKGASSASRNYVLGDNDAFMCSRVGGLEGIEGAPSFSTLTCFLKEEMTVESKLDRDNRANKGRVVDDYAMVMTAPVSGVLFQNILTA